MIRAAHLYEDAIRESTKLCYGNSKYDLLFLHKVQDFPIFKTDTDIIKCIDLGRSRWDVVSVNSDNKVLGRFSVFLSNNEISEVETVSYEETPSFAFCKDLKWVINEFIRAGLTRGVKVTWYVIEGNPIEKVHERYLKKYGGEVSYEIVGDVEMKKYTLG